MEDVHINGKVVIVTGANGGIGKATALELARQALDAVRQEIVAETGNSDVVVRQLDLASLQSVRRFAQDFIKSESRLDILVNNAGVFTRHRQHTADGFELHFGVNHLGHFLLTYLLLDKLIESAPSRIVTVSSKGSEFTKIDLSDLQTKRHWTSLKAYSRSKTANVLFTRHLAMLLQGTGVSTYCLHPGIVSTDLARDFEDTLAMSCFNVVWSCFCGSLLTPAEGAQTTLYCCLEPSIADVSGRYYSECREKKARKHVTNSATAQKLWRLSAELCGVSPNPLINKVAVL
jgi:NAD(P)-dependent dehydrogenase (short-subunit alcohol dehydrogenase family)